MSTFFATEDVTDERFAFVNSCVRIANGFERFALAVIEDNRRVRASKLRGINLYNETGNDTRKSIRYYPTTLRASTVARHVESIRVLARLAARVSRLASADEDMPNIDRAARVALARVANLDRALWQVFDAQGKQHLKGTDASLLERDGTAWDASLKGRGAHGIRHSATAESYVRGAKTDHSYVCAHSLSERDISRLAESY